ncbi:EpsG family protein [Fusobacterium animalis]|uniref:EpsG family protein n=1 Tax=Fusobacterium animalis TaxID=76859 RepID=UPI001C6EFA0F|nr:EpsG family protein [Fusobacterium animalis]QYR63963.1 EpsG family protein [Fusobacterium animalis]
MFYCYFIIFLSLLFNSVRFEFTRRKKYFYFYTFLVVFIYAFAYQVGVDWTVYQKYYIRTIPQITFSSVFQDKFYFEKGYLLVNVIFNSLNINYEIASGLIVSVCIFIWFKFLKKYSWNFYFALILLLPSSFADYLLQPVIRQLISITIFLVAFKYIEKKNFFKYMFLIIISVQFHRSAFLCIFIYFIQYFKINYKTIFLYIFGIYTFILVFPYIIDKIPVLSSYKNYFLSMAHTGYVERTIYVKVLKILILIIRISLIYLSYPAEDNRTNLIKNLAIIFIIISYFQNIIPILARVQGYFLIFYIICMSYLAKLRLGRVKISKNIGVIFICILSIMTLSIYYKVVYGTKINKYIYSKYKNYFIEMLTGDLEQDFYQKARPYVRELNKLKREEGIKEGEEP